MERTILRIKVSIYNSIRTSGTKEMKGNAASCFVQNLLRLKILEKSENPARLPDQALDAVISFYGTLVDRAAQLPRTKGHDPASEDPDDVLPVHVTFRTHKSVQSHKRSASTSTSTSGSTTTSAPPTSLAYLKHPLEIAVALYLAHLSTRIKTLSPTHLQDVVATLVRATAFCATPLYMLSPVAKYQPQYQPQYQPPSFSNTAWKRDIEDKITDFLTQLLSVWLGPPGSTPRLFDPSALFSTGESQTQLQQARQVQPAPSLGVTPLQNSPIPTQPGTPIPPPASLPASQHAQSLPSSYFPSASPHLSLFHPATSSASSASLLQTPMHI
ncbi:hypothetical protein M378DRAFT_180497 [Amanita muscaria Koide BX008]|uniref:Uncharacterized protein n=1 Tax=Amanita muscaria (strain Koide BX008) TaxID=946122 RepID=A0A0C2WU31_AMAMK|nr:hypothetical protein M378DRAFT_180497 [Amanita muscaria Koide BX008]